MLVKSACGTTGSRRKRRQQPAQQIAQKVLIQHAIGACKVNRKNQILGKNIAGKLFTLLAHHKSYLTAGNKWRWIKQRTHIETHGFSISLVEGVKRGAMPNKDGIHAAQTRTHTPRFKHPLDQECKHTRRVLTHLRQKDV